MGRKPVLTLAGTLLTSLALAGCQSTPARPTNPNFPGAAKNNTGGNPTGPYMANGQPGGATAIQSSTGSMPTGGSLSNVQPGPTMSNTPSFNSSSLNSPGRIGTGVNGSAVPPPAPTPITAGGVQGPAIGSFGGGNPLTINPAVNSNSSPYGAGGAVKTISPTGLTNDPSASSLTMPNNGPTSARPLTPISNQNTYHDATSSMPAFPGPDLLRIQDVNGPLSIVPAPPTGLSR